MYAGYTATTEQDRARWKLMKRNAQRRAKAKADASRQPSKIETPHAATGYMKSVSL